MSPYTATNFYQIGGSLPSNSPSYVKRKADDDLFYHLKGGHFCYVLTARQMGKSSLRVQTMKRLMEHGFLCSAIDLTSIGTHNVSAEQWYYSLLDRVSYDLGIFEEFEAWWEDNLRLSPVSRFGNFLEQVVLKQKNQPIAIFLDEIDTVLSLNSKDFDTDDFFAVIRSFYNARDNNTDFNRLNFALFGVASPDALMRDTVRTPFNIGVPIYLENFHFDESKQVLMQGFAEITQESEKLLKIVFDYTSGQPYLTQKICAHLLQKRQIVNNEEVVKQIVEQLFLSHDNGELDANLANIQNRISSDTTYGVEMLHIYQDLLNKNSIAIKRSDPTHIYLRLSGLVSESKGFLKIDNKIYEQFFNKKWVVELLGKLDRPFTYDLERWLNSGKNDSATALRGTLLQEMREWSKKKLLTDLEKEFLIFSQDIDLEEKDRAYKAKESERNALQLKQEKKEGKALKMRNIALLVALAITILASVITINIQRRYLNADKELDEKIAELSKREQQYNQLLDRNDDLSEEIDAKADSALAYSIKLRELQEKYGAILKQLETGEKETNDANNNAAQIAELNALKKALSQLRTDTMNLRQQIRNLQKKSELADKPVPEQICRTARLAIIQFKYGDDNQFEQGIYKTHTERNTKFIARELIDKKTFTNLRSIKQDYFENFVDKETIRSQGYEGYISGNFIPSRSGDIVARIDVYIFGQSKPCTNFVITGIPEKTFFDNSKISIDQIKERYKDVIQNMPTQMRFSFGN